MAIGIVAAEPQPLLLDGVQQMLAATEEFVVLQSCTSGTELMDALDHHVPDIVLMDTRLPGIGGLTVLAEIRRRGLPVRVVLFVDAITEADLFEAIRLGVEGVLLKDMPSRLLLQCLHKVHGGGRWVESVAVQGALEAAIRREHRTTALSPRERETARMVALGLRNKAIARRLSISEGTVKVHVRNVYRKLGLNTRVAVRCYAEEHKLL